MKKQIKYSLFLCGIPVVLIFALVFWAAIREMQSEELGTKFDAASLGILTGLLGSLVLSTLVEMASQLNDLKKELDELKKSRLEVADQE